jgi:predicted nucleic acid-binding protein
VTAVIVDTSAILAIFDEAYREHGQLAKIIEETTSSLVVSPLVVAEADYMLQSRLGHAAARRFADDIASEAYELAEWSAADHAAALTVMDRYGDQNDYIGVAAAANIILADTYRTTMIMTMDQRHFRALRPRWGAEYFTILPYDA